jgi:hypothetical protein
MFNFSIISVELFHPHDLLPHIWRSIWGGVFCAFICYTWFLVLYFLLNHRLKYF